MSKSPNAVPDVSTLRCVTRANLFPGDEDRHVIENVAGGRGAECVFCGVPWAQLDAQLRATLPNRGRPVA